MNHLHSNGIEKGLVPCGQCWKCMAREHREWAVRIIHEAKLHSENSFITLTYRPQDLPENGTLVKKHIQKFIKRLRRRIEPLTIRYYAAGEYGSKFNRSHYHLVIFGMHFEDKKYWRKSRQGFPIYRSKMLEKTWPYGHSEIGEFTPSAAAYTANYITKRVKGKKAEDHYQGRIPEFSLMSRDPPIGYEYYLKNRDEILEKGTVTFRDKEIPVPRTYERVYAKLHDTP